jgi:hypothetical protein
VVPVIRAALGGARADPGGELARDVTELASVARLGNVTMRVVDAGDLASANAQQSPTAGWCRDVVIAAATCF